MSESTVMDKIRKKLKTSPYWYSVKMLKSVKNLVVIKNHLKYIVQIHKLFVPIQLKLWILLL